MIPESHKKLVYSLADLQKRLGDTILIILNAVPEIETAQEDIDKAIVASTRLLGIYQNIDWNNTEKYKRIMEILHEP